MNLSIKGSPNSKPVVHFKSLAVKPTLNRRLDSSPRKALLFRESYVQDDFSKNVFSQAYADKSEKQTGLQIQTTPSGRDIRVYLSKEKFLSKSKDKKLFSLSGVNKNNLERIYLSNLKGYDQSIVESSNQYTATENFSHEVSLVGKALKRKSIDDGIQGTLGADSQPQKSNLETRICSPRTSTNFNSTQSPGSTWLKTSNFTPPAEKKTRNSIWQFNRMNSF